MNKITFLKSLITILWSKTWPPVCWYVGGFSVIILFFAVIGQISLWCGMPPMGTEGWGNAISHVPQLDNGLAIIAFGAFFVGFPIAIICIAVKAVKEFITNLRGIVKQAADKSINSK